MQAHGKKVRLGAGCPKLCQTWKGPGTPMVLKPFVLWYAGRDMRMR